MPVHSKKRKAKGGRRLASSEDKIVRKDYYRKAHKRRAYRRKDGTLVRSTTVKRTYVPKTKIKDRGYKGHGSKLITLDRNNALGRYGYKFNLKAADRRKALRKAVDAYGYGKTVKRLVALRTLTKNTNPVMSHKAGADVKYLQREYRGK